MRDTTGGEGPKTLNITLADNAVSGVDIGGGKTLMPGAKPADADASHVYGAHDVPAHIAVRLLANGRAKKTELKKKAA